MARIHQGVIIVDGSNLLHRSSAVAMRLIGEAEDPGVESVLASTVAGTSLLLSRMTHFPQEWDNGAIMVAFDQGGDSGRKLLYPKYKSNREAYGGMIAAATEAMIEVCARLGMAVYADSEHEADDLIAALWEQARMAGHPRIIVSNDRDLWQLIDEQTTIRVPKAIDRGESKPGDPAKFREVGLVQHWQDYGFAPKLLPDFKALKGDSDGYPGVKGIGEVWAQRLVADLGGLDHIFDKAAESVKRPEVRASLLDAEQQQNARLFRDLATLRRDAPLPQRRRPSGSDAPPQMGPR